MRRSVGGLTEFAIIGKTANYNDHSTFIAPFQCPKHDSPTSKRTTQNLANAMTRSQPKCSPAAETAASRNDCEKRSILVADSRRSGGRA